MAAVHGVPAGGYCGRAREIQDAINGFTGGTYDPNGNLLTVTDVKNQMTMYAYDTMVATMVVSQAAAEKGTGYFFGAVRGRPRGRNVEVRPSVAAILACQSDVPKGCWRFTQVRRAVRS